MKCRRCKQAEGTIFLDGKRQATKTPACRDCFEELELNAMNRTGCGHEPGYTGPGRDPDHAKLSMEHIEAMDWWNSQVRDDSE